MISHSFGLENYDASTLLKKKPALAEYMVWSCGAGEKETSLKKMDSFCLRYMKENFLEFGNEWRNAQIMVPDLHQLKVSLENKAVIEKIIKSFNNYVFISNINYFQNLSETVGYDKQQMDEYFKHLSEEENALLLFPLDSPVALLVTLPESDRETLHQTFLKSNQNARGFLTIHRDIFENEQKNFTLVNMIAAPWHMRIDFQQTEYCKICSQLGDKCFHIFKDDLESDTFWSGMSERLSKIAKNPTSKIDEDEDRENFAQKIIARSVVLEAAVEDKFPELLFCKDDDDKKIRMKILNRKQRVILLDKSSKKKLIKGIYFIFLFGLRVYPVYCNKKVGVNRNFDIWK